MRYRCGPMQCPRYAVLGPVVVVVVMSPVRGRSTFEVLAPSMPPSRAAPRLRIIAIKADHAVVMLAFLTSCGVTLSDALFVLLALFAFGWPWLLAWPPVTVFIIALRSLGLVLATPAAALARPPLRSRPRTGTATAQTMKP